MKKILSSNKGFSLIELIVVIAILGVLVGVAAPNLLGYIEKTRVATDINTVENVRRAAEAYYAEKEGADTDISADDLKVAFPKGLPILRSKGSWKDKAPTISVNAEGIVIVTPNVQTLKGEAAPAPTDG